MPKEQLHGLFLQSELAAQKEALDTEHCKALETLKNQVHVQSSQQHYIYLSNISNINQKSEHHLITRQVFSSTHPVQVCGGAGAYGICHRARSGVHPGQVAILSQGLLLLDILIRNNDLFLCPLQVLELEQQHTTALQELSQTCTAEKEQLIKHHQVQLQVCA